MAKKTIPVGSNIVDFDIRHEFSEEEKAKLGEGLARKELEVTGEREEKAQTSRDFNERIKKMEADIQQTSIDIERGYSVEVVQARTEIDVDANVRRFWSTGKKEKLLGQEALETGQQYQGEL